jgi:hypothetical protein
LTIVFYPLGCPCCRAVAFVPSLSSVGSIMFVLQL